jgi:Tfp pilus assembly protein PilO
VRLEQVLHRRLRVLLLAGAGLAVLNAVVYFTAVSKLDRFAKSAKARVETNRARLVDLEGKRDKLTASVESVRQDRKVIDVLTGKVLRTRAERLVEMQEELHKLADRNQVALDTVGYAYSLVPSSEKDAFGRQFLRVSMQLPLSGTYQQVKSLIQDLQASPQFFILEGITLSADSQGGVNLRLNLSLSTYFVADKADLEKREKGGGA